MSSLPKTFLSPEEYLEYDRRSEDRNEYYNGEMFAMSGGSSPHAWIIGSITAQLWQQLKSKPCRVSPTTLRLRVGETGLYTYPDVMVVCGEPQHADDREDTLANPVVIVEVLSPSTGDYDRGMKFQNYRTLPSLLEYLTVAQDAPHIEHWTRQPEDRWLLTEFKDSAQSIELTSIGCRLPLSEIYLKIDFTPGS